MKSRINRLCRFAGVSGIVVLSFAGLLLYCSHPAVLERPAGAGGEGTGARFPVGQHSEALTRILKSVKLLNSTGYYESFFFSRAVAVQSRDVRKGKFAGRASERVFHNHSTAGSAVVLHSSRLKMLVLTCEHVVNFPDTVYQYYQDRTGRDTPYLERVSLRRQHQNTVVDVEATEEFQVLAADKKWDLAILGITFNRPQPELFPAVRLPTGKKVRPRWGDLVYVVGFPKGFQMVTHGIVSQPNRNGHESFLIDAPINRGSSGSLVLVAARDAPNLEWAGVATAMATDEIEVLAPDEDEQESNFLKRKRYEGNIYRKKYTQKNYGVTFVTSTEAVVKFLKRNRSVLARQGFDVEQLLR